jgi:hypothetical protein
MAFTRTIPPAADTLAPPAPAAPTVTVLDETSVRVDWAAIADAVSPPGQFTSGTTICRIYRNGLFAKNVDESLRTWTDTGLTPSTAYTYKLKGIDAAGNVGVFGPSTTVTTSSGVVERRNNVGHWVDVPSFERENFSVDQAASAAGTPQAGVPRTGVVYSTTGDYGGGRRKLAGASPSYPTADRLNIAGVKGAMMRYTWRELESTQNVYTFDRVAEELEQCAAIGTARGSRFGFLLFLGVNTFSGELPLPPYLSAYATNEASSDSWNTWRWNSTIRTRFAALVQELAAQFDAHPCWEGIATSETATKAANGDPLSGYTHAGFLAGLLDETAAIAAACTNGRHFFYHNFFPISSEDDNLDAVVAAGVANGAMVMCAPDILPGKDALESRVYPRYKRTVAAPGLPVFQGQLPFQCSAQNDSHHWNSTLESETTGPYDSMTSIFNFARNTLKCNYVMWTWKRTGGGSDFADDALVINATPTWTPSPGWTPP